MSSIPPRYRVGPFREVGLIAQWTHLPDGGGPIIRVKEKESDPWVMVDMNLWTLMVDAGGIREGWESRDMTTFFDSPMFNFKR